MKMMKLAGALAGMLGRIPAQVRENLQLIKLTEIAVTPVKEALGQVADKFAEKRAQKRANRAMRRRGLSIAKRSLNAIPLVARRKMNGYFDRPSKLARACGHNTHVRGH